MLSVSSLALVLLLQEDNMCCFKCSAAAAAAAERRRRAGHHHEFLASRLISPKGRRKKEAFICLGSKQSWKNQCSRREPLAAEPW